MEKIFVSVLNMSISGSVIIAAVIIMRFLFKRLPRVYSYALWSIPAIRLLCPISVSSVVSFFNFLKPEVSENRMEYIAPPTTAYVAPTLPQNPVVTPMPPTYRDPMEDVVKEVPKSLSLGEIAGIIWALVAVGIIIWAAASYISVRLRVKDSRESGGYYVCENIPSPFVFGIFRPRIFLPSGLSEQDSECIVMHERTHIRRRDYLIKLLTVPILALHWFNPLVWLAIKLMTADMELSCDEQALKDFSPEYKKVYAGALLNVSLKQNGISLNGVLGFGESNIKSRIKGVLHMKKPKLWAVLAAVAAAVVLAVCLLTNAMGKTESSALPDRFDGYISLQKAKIPELHFDETADISAFVEQTAPKILFAKAEAGDVTAYLLGEGVYREEGESDAVRAIDLKVGISTDGRIINAAYPAPAEFVGTSQAHYKIYAGETYLMGFDMELPIIELRYIGEGSNMGAFYAVKDGEPRLLTGDLSDIGGEAAGVCFKYNALDMRILSAEKENGSNLKYTFTPDSSAIEFTFDFDSIRADGYAGPHFTAKRAGAALSENSEFEDIINRYMLFERIFRIDSLSFGSVNGPDDREIGPEDGVLINGDIYYPVNEDGFTEWRQLEDFMRGLFTDELAEANLSDGHYVERDGKTFSLMAGGGGWYASPDYIYGTEELDDGRLRLDFYREWDRNEVGEYYTVKLILENTPDGYRIAEASQDYVTDYDSYDWLAPVNRFVQKEFYFNPDFTGRHDAEDAGESIISEIAHNVTVTFRYTSDGEFIDAFTDGREESVDEICALDENRLLVYDWDLIARDQIYLLNFETGTTEPVLPDTAFGFSFNDYYDITGKYERIEWVTTPRISPDGRKILYESNKYAENGKPVYRLGLWVYDIQSGTEERIARPEEADPDMVTASYNWTEDGRVLFSCFSTGGEYVLDYIYDPASKETAPLTTAESVKNVTRNFDGQVISVDIPIRWQSYTLEDYSLQHVGIQIYDGDIPAQREMYGGKLFIASAVSGFAQSYIESQEALGVSYDVSDYTTASGYKMKLCYRDGVLDYATFDDFKSMCIFFDLDEQDDMSVIFGIIDSVVFSAGGESSAQTISYDEAKDILSEALEEYAQYSGFGSIELSSDGGTAAREIKVGKSDGIFTEYAYCFTARYISGEKLPRVYAVTADIGNIYVYDPADETDEEFYNYLSSAESYEYVPDYVRFTDFYAKAQAYNNFLSDRITTYYSILMRGGHIEDDESGWSISGDIGVQNVHFMLPTEWEYGGGSTADLNGSKVFEISTPFLESEYSPDMFRVFPEGTRYPQTFNANEGESSDITVYEETEHGWTVDEPYLFSARSRSDGYYGSFDHYDYVVRAGEYCVYVSFTAGNGFDPESSEGKQLCMDILRSIVVEPYDVPELTEENMNSLIGDDLELLKILYTDYLPIDRSDTVTRGGVTYYRVTGEYSGFEAVRVRMEAVYTDHFIGEITGEVYGRLAVRNVDGKTYRSEGIRLDIPNSARFTPDSNDIEGRMEVQGAIENGARYMFELTLDGWRIDNRWNDPWIETMLGQ